MPLAAPKQCSHSGCSTLVRGGSRCPVHQAEADAAYAERQQQNRDRIADRRAMYRTPQWRRIRAAFLSSNPLCVVCGQAGEHVDHIRPHLGDSNLFLDWDNLQTLCLRCHGRKTASTDGGFGNRKKVQH